MLAAVSRGLVGGEQWRVHGKGVTQVEGRWRRCEIVPRGRGDWSFAVDDSKVLVIPLLAYSLARPGLVDGVSRVRGNEASGGGGVVVGRGIAGQ